MSEEKGYTNIFRRGDSILIDVTGEESQIALSLEEILELEDLDLRSTTTGELIND